VLTLIITPTGMWLARLPPEFHSLDKKRYTDLVKYNAWQEYATWHSEIHEGEIVECPRASMFIIWEI